MTFDEEQCPSRGPGLTHATADGANCDHCGAWRVSAAPAAPNLIEWLKAMRQPRVVKVSGEDPQIQAVEATAEPDEEKLGDWAALTEQEWHRAVLVRAAVEKHDPEWDEDCDARPDL